MAALLKPFRLFPIKPFKPDARRFPDIWTKNRLASLPYLQYPESLRRHSFSFGASGPQESALRCGVRGMAIRLTAVLGLRSIRLMFGPRKALT